ncbi:hypothetical protein D3C73_1616290 [compost metagenome]
MWKATRTAIYSAKEPMDFIYRDLSILAVTKETISVVSVIKVVLAAKAGVGISPN